ncbi:beta strand repeat-containing protein [Zavarzinia compransoris]|uniref:Filamentous haemagglutinin FhaB/tRNA nuclease CdiA-like TPS domain-containing protein n=1 Tax=Zavarzinia compransoris TaxID=1264899 RepID=A0A317E6S4_9PROT|nr:filamentous hemagglutinin N-terminal domain-containing protein [Zavarzinia compransoris]PWR22321.1 hypothetical protein DKG75_10220 [Zavarzinia compransoris]TDP46914.1 filamentous hemagglutinin family protein [Zavarzinia compransoris]
MTGIFLPSTRHAALLATTALGLVAATGALANPTGGTVTQGGATISTAPGTVTVEQTTDRAVIEWRDFSIGEGETTRFLQPGSGSVALNRVTGDNPSAILGTLTANGNVFLINRSGILVGAGATVDVGGLVATTSDIDDGAFMAGGGLFDRPGGIAGAGVINDGTITVADHGLAALVGPTVANNGTIAARLGTVALGSAETFTVDLAGDGLISFDTGQPVARAGGAPQVANSGTIAADGGTVLLTAGQAASVVDKAIDMTGVITARSVGVDNGVIVLSGGEGTASVSGLIDGSGTTGGTTGGTVEVTGAQVRIESGATIDVSGTEGGGTARIGGGLKGQGATPRAATTVVAAGSTIDASATGSGHGGTIIVWSDRATEFAGNAFARGGAAGGNGGLIETSSKGVLSLGAALIDASAPLGQGGEWLIDPADVGIVDAGTVLPSNPFNPGTSSSLINIDSIIAVLQTGTDVTINTGSAGDGLTGSGTISYSATPAAFAIGGDGSATLTLNAVGAITWSGTLAATGDFTLRANAGERITFTLGSLSAQTIDLRGCLTSSSCGAPPVSVAVPPIGIVFDPFVAGTSGFVPTVTLTGQDVSLRGGLGGIFSDIDTTINVGRSLTLQGSGAQAFTFAANTFAPTAGATATFVPAFADTDLAYTQRETVDTLNSGIDNRDLEQLAGFASITLRTGAGVSTFAAAGTGGTAGITFDGAFAGATLNLAQDLIVDANGGGSIAVDTSLAVTSTANITLEADNEIRLPGGLTLDGDLTATAPNIFLGADLQSSGGALRLTGAVGAENSLGLMAGGDILIAGTLDGTEGSPSPIQPQIFLTSETGSVTVTGATGALFILESLTAFATTGISVADVATTLDQSYVAPTVILTGTTYQAGGGFDLEGAALVANAAAVTTAGNIRFSGTVARASGAATASLTASAGAGTSTGTVFIGDTVASAAAPLDALSVTGGSSFTVHSAWTSGNQSYSAPAGSFAGTRYVSSAGSIDAGGTVQGTVMGGALFDANGSAGFATLNMNAAGGTLEVIARTGNVTVAGPLGATTAPVDLRLQAAATLNVANLFSAGPVALTGATVRLAGTTYTAATGFAATGAVALAANAAITAGQDLTITGTVDLDSGAPAGTGLTLRSTAAGIAVTGAIGGGSAPAFVTADAAVAIALGNVATTGAQAYTAPAVTLNGTAYGAGGDFQVTGATLLNAAVGITTGGSTSLSATVTRAAGAAAAGLTVNAGGGSGGTIFIGGEAGTAASVLDAVSLTAGSSISVNNVRTSGNQTYSTLAALFNGTTYVSSAGSIDAAGVTQGTLTAGTLFDAAGNAGFGALDMSSTGGTLNVRARTGSILFGGAVGALSAPTALTATAATTLTAANLTSTGTIDLTAPAISLTGTAYGAGTGFSATGALGLLAGATVTAAGALTVTGTIDSQGSPANGLTLTSTAGAVTVTGAAGGTGALAFLTANAATALSLGSVVTTGNQTLAAPTVTLTGTTYRAGGTVGVTGTGLIANAVAIDATGGITFSAGIERAAGAATASLTALAGGGGPTGTIAVAGAIGSPGTALDSVTLTAGAGLALNGVVTSGDQSYAAATGSFAGGTYRATAGSITGLNVGQATLTASTTFTAGQNIRFGRIDMATTGLALAMTAQAGEIRLTGPVGGSGAPASITLQGASAIVAADLRATGAIALTAPAITLTGAVYQAGTTFAATGNLAFGGAAAVTAGQALTVSGTIDRLGSAPLDAAVALVSTGGDVRLGGAIGATQALGSLTVDAAGRAVLNSVRVTGDIALGGAAVELAGGTAPGGPNTPAVSQALVAGGAVTVTGPTLLAGTTVIDAGGGIAFSSTIDAAAGSTARLTAQAGGGLTAGGPIGGTNALAALDLSAGGPVTLLGARTTGALSLTSGTGLALGGTYASSAGALDIDGPLSLAGDVVLTAATAIQLSGPVTEASGGGTLRASAAGGDLAVNGAVEAGAVTLSASATLAVGAVTSRGDLALTGTTIQLTGGALVAGNDVLATGALALLGDATITGRRNVTVTGPIGAESGSPALGLTAETGFVAANGPITGLGDLTVEAATTASLGQTAIAGGLSVNAGSIQFTGPAYNAGGNIILDGPLSLAANTAVTAGGGVGFAGAIGSASASSPVGLTVSAGGGIAFLGAAGLASLNASAAGTIEVFADALTSGTLLYRSAAGLSFAEGSYRSSGGAVTLDGPVIFTGAVVFQAATDLNVTGAIDGVTDEGVYFGSATLIAGNNLIIPGAIGLDTPLAALNLQAGTMIDPLSVITFGPQTYTAPLIILAGTEYRTNGGAFTTNGALRLTAPAVTINTGVFTPITSPTLAAGGDLIMNGTATGQFVTLRTGNGMIEALHVAFSGLSVFGEGGSASMAGTLGTFTGPPAARHITRSSVNRAYLFNDCVMATFCGIQELEGATQISLPAIVPLAPPLIEIPDLIVARIDDPLGDASRFVFSNTGKDALWRLDLSFPAATEENGR